jgi:hypothetical protein
MLGQNARKTTDRQARRVPPSVRRNGWFEGIRSDSAPRRSERDWGDGQDDDDDPDSVLGVQVSIVDAMRSIRSIMASGMAGGHGGDPVMASGGGGGTAEGGGTDDEGTDDMTPKAVDDTSGSSRG